MGSKWKSYLLPALLISCLVVFLFNYRELFGNHLFLLQNPLDRPSSQTSNNTQPAELAIRLHPDQHREREPTTLREKWHITKDYRSPDGVRKLVYLINGQFPGPTLEARSGDTMVIEVYNELEDEGVAIHWHGLRMKGYNSMDGVVGITQAPIPSTGNFTYEFKVGNEQAGTFWYHSHEGIQRADGLYGGLIVHKPIQKDVFDSTRFQFEEDNLLMIGDWYLQSAEHVQESYEDPGNWGHEPVPSSVLINGKGKYDCSSHKRDEEMACTNIFPPRLSLKSSRSRLRVTNVGILTGFTLKIPHCRMTVFQLDGGNVIEKSPESSSIGILYPGERMDLIMECDAITHSTDSEMTITLDSENFSMHNTPSNLAHYFPLQIASSTLARKDHSPSPTTDEEKPFYLRSAKGDTLPENTIQGVANQTYMFYVQMETGKEDEDIPTWGINGTAWAPQASPSTPLIDLSRAYWNTNQFVPFIALSRDPDNATWVDIVVNNFDMRGHPFHLHGYDFYVLSQYYPTSHHHSYNTYNPFSPSEASSPPGGSYNLINPIKKDTVYIPGMGYVVLRILADNVGIWFFHCHILTHSSTGMAMALEVGERSGRYV